MKNHLISIILLAWITILPKGQAAYRVFVDGTFDLAHYGHQQVFINAKTTGAQYLNTTPDQIELIVGVSGTDDEIKNYKRPSVYSIKEKMRQISGFKGVDQVINSPMVTTKEFLQQNSIDLVVAGDDYSDLSKAKKYYAAAIEMKKFKTFPRTQGISTTEIMKRTAQRVVEQIRLNLGENNLEDQKTLEKFIKLMEERFH